MLPGRRPLHSWSLLGSSDHCFWEGRDSTWTRKGWTGSLPRREALGEGTGPRASLVVPGTGSRPLGVRHPPTQERCSLGPSAGGPLVLPPGHLLALPVFPASLPTL